jgi:hypothetical protein
MDYRGRNIQAYATNRGQKDIFDLIGAGAPTSGTSGTGANVAGPGSSYFDYTNKIYYWNSGSKASPTWSIDGLVNVTGDITVNGSGVSAIGANKVLSSMLATDVLVKATGTISSANITGTSAGQFGHAAGVLLTPIAAANTAWQLVAVGMYYTFATAAYTAGGNITVNFAGGAAITGLVSAANSVGAASSKGIMFFPLAAAGNAIVSAVSLNLVTSAAFTQPGTAAGTIAWECWYRAMAVGF